MAGARGRGDGVKIHGAWVPVNAQIARIDSMSAHADSAEILQWLTGFSKPPRVTYLVHGEPVPMDALKVSIERQAGWTVRTPALGEQVEL